MQRAAESILREKFPKLQKDASPRILRCSDLPVGNAHQASKEISTKSPSPGVL